MFLSLLLAFFSFDVSADSQVKALSIHTSVIDWGTFCVHAQDRKVYCWGDPGPFAASSWQRWWEPTVMGEGATMDRLLDMEFDKGILVGTRGSKIVAFQGRWDSTKTFEFEYEKTVREIRVGPYAAGFKTALIVSATDGSLELRGHDGTPLTWYRARFPELRSTKSKMGFFWDIGSQDGVCNLTLNDGVICGFNGEQSVRRYLSGDVVMMEVRRDNFAYILGSDPKKIYIGEFDQVHEVPADLESLVKFTYTFPAKIRKINYWYEGAYSVILEDGSVFRVTRFNAEKVSDANFKDFTAISTNASCGIYAANDQVKCWGADQDLFGSKSLSEDRYTLRPLDVGSYVQDWSTLLLESHDGEEVKLRSEQTHRLQWNSVTKEIKTADLSWNLPIEQSTSPSRDVVYSDGSLQCVRGENREMYCAGSMRDTYGTIFMGTKGLDTTPKYYQHIPEMADLHQFDSEESHLCGLDSASRLHCWGSVSALGASVPQSKTSYGGGWTLFGFVPEGLPPVKDFKTGFLVSCARDFSDSLWCWGNLRTHDIQERASIVATSVLDYDVRWSTYCVLNKNTDLTCKSDEPSDVWQKENTGFVEISGQCGRTAEGQVKCWGDNYRHRYHLGNPGMMSDFILISEGLKAEALIKTEREHPVFRVGSTIYFRGLTKSRYTESEGPFLIIK